MLMTSMSFNILRGMAIPYEYKTDTDTKNILRDATTKYLHFVGKIKHETFNIPQWMPPNVKTDVKLQLPPSIFFAKSTWHCI